MACQSLWGTSHVNSKITLQTMQKIKILGSERRVYKKWQTLAIIQEIFDSNLETRRYGPVSGVSRIIWESWHHWLFVPTWKLSAIVWTPIQYVTLHFQNQPSAGSLRYRNHAKITVLLCEQKPYPVWFSCQCKSYTPRGGDSHMKQTGMLRGVNFGFWSHLGCSGQSADILSRQGFL